MLSSPLPPVISESLDDLMLPRVVVIVDAAEAEALGAFEETALSEADAWDANADVEDDEATHGE
jgi:hypothetical protein